MGTLNIFEPWIFDKFVDRNKKKRSLAWKKKTKNGCWYLDCWVYVESKIVVRYLETVLRECKAWLSLIFLFGK